MYAYFLNYLFKEFLWNGNERPTLIVCLQHEEHYVIPILGVGRGDRAPWRLVAPWVKPGEIAVRRLLSKGDKCFPQVDS